MVERSDQLFRMKVLGVIDAELLTALLSVRIAEHFIVNVLIIV